MDGAIHIADNLAAETHEVSGFTPLKFPGIAMLQPGLGIFELPAILDALTKHAVDVAQAIPAGWQIKRGQTIHEAGSEAAQAAIAQCCVGFKLLNPAQIHAMRL